MWSIACGAAAICARDQFGVGVAAKQRRLEEEEARRPHPGRAAEPGQDLLGDHRLDEEQQESGKEDRARIRQDHKARTDIRRRGRDGHMNADGISEQRLSSIRPRRILHARLSFTRVNLHGRVSTVHSRCDNVLLRQPKVKEE